ncbi:MAG: hemolysin family protein [Flavobacteriales bacterium]|nr:hemolysin family protein [Flavobacteriales bacterium]MCW8913815.1 hemolysin family protein [Flavobacteriales bacterium]MCW8937931.1 hemolysin family protein [Flavobacteriales bacterium]MCW8939709.1 hemolysin family protein [Flavobacteriales bacterium]MCW8968284.1 hemolysin family protein [Flavobacteriales bacterium]
MPSSDIIFILIAMLFSAVFSGMEIAFVTANRLKIELSSKKGVFSGKILSFFLKKPAKFISAMLIGNNIALVIYSILMAKLLEPIIYKHITTNDFFVLFIQTVISTILILFFSEFLPKSLLRINPNKALTIAAIPLQIIYILLYPFTLLVLGVSNLILKLFRVDTSESDMAFTKIDLEHFMTNIQQKKEEGEDVDNEIQIFKNALDFSSVKARDCMVPRTDLVAMDIEIPLPTIRDKFIETGLSKILIYRDSIDNIIGYIHSKELFRKPKTVKSILLPISIIPESMPANQILQEFITHRKSVAVVVDEFGGTSGIITTEDIIEEIFGDIEDEHDNEELTEIKIDEDLYQFSARLEIDYINEKYMLNLPESDDYETLAGLIISVDESIPEKDEIIRHNGLEIKIDKVSNNKIDLVTIHITDNDE